MRSENKAAEVFDRKAGRKVMKKRDFAEIIEKLCPSETAESWDNCGFQINGTGSEISTVLVALEVTEAVIDEAERKGAQLILTHHPMLFHGIKRIDSEEIVGKYIFRLVQRDISVYSCHTSFDKLQGGNNDYLGLLFGFENVRPFVQDNGFCRKGDISGGITLGELSERVSDVLETDRRLLRCVGSPDRVLYTAGWCSGAGSEYISDAAREGCDVYITGDLKYHQAQEAKEMGMCLIDAGHYGSEKNFVQNMAGLLRKNCGDRLSILESDSDLNPFFL